MADESEQKPIDRVFAELKAKGVVAAETELKREEADWWLDFAAYWNSQVIGYNEKHSFMEDNLLEFAFSHEQFHLVNSKNWTRLSILRAGGIMIVFLSMIGFLDILGLVLLPFALIALWFATLWMFGPALRADETDADLHAARALIEKFKIEKPSVVATSLFKILRESNWDRTELIYRARRFIYAGLHPRDDDRVDAIKEFEESYPGSLDP